MAVEESLKSKRSYKVLLGTLKVIPMLLALCEACNTMLGFFGVDVAIFSILGGISLLPLIFLYLASYVFRFCEYHRMFLHYIVASNLITIVDFYFGIPVNILGLFVIQVGLIGIFLFLILYLHQKECGK